MNISCTSSQEGIKSPVNYDLNYNIRDNAKRALAELVLASDASVMTRALAPSEVYVFNEPEISTFRQSEKYLISRISPHLSRTQQFISVAWAEINKENIVLPGPCFKSYECKYVPCIGQFGKGGQYELQIKRFNSARISIKMANLRSIKQANSWTGLFDAGSARVTLVMSDRKEIVIEFKQDGQSKRFAEKLQLYFPHALEIE